VACEGVEVLGGGGDGVGVAIVVEVGDGERLGVGVSVGIEVTIFGVICGTAGDVDWHAVRVRKKIIGKRLLDFICQRIAYMFNFTNTYPLLLK